MKKRKLTIYDLGRIERTPVQGETGFDRTLADYNRRIESESQEAAAAEQQRLNTVQKGLTKAFWGRPLAEIGNPRVWREDGAYDPFVGLSDGRFDNMSIDRAFTEFLHRSHTLTGYVLDEDGSKRLCWFGLAQSTHQKDLSTSEAWAKCFDRLLECDAYAYGEIVYHENTKRVVVEQSRDEHLTMDDLMNVNAESRGGFQKAAQIAESLYFDERQGLVREWFASLQKFGIEITQADAKRCKQWFERNNKSFLNPRHFDECRRWNANAGYWPDALTSEESLNREIESLDTNRLTVAQRNDLNRRVQAAREADARRFGQ